LEQAIVVLEDQRAILGSDVVDMAVAALRQKLLSLQNPSTMEQYDQITVLVADMSGFTAMSELMDAEEVRDIINAVWEKLDSVIEAWGGQIDKHVGDGVIALFGVSTDQKDDAERAIQAALDMQMELALFNEQTIRQLGEVQFSWSRSHTLRMRVGIHAGPVFLGQVGASGEYTVVGDTVSIAHQLEKSAPIGSILISHDVYCQTPGLFDSQSWEPLTLAGRPERLQVYLVKREKPYTFRTLLPAMEESEARLVGHDAQLEQLQQILQTTIDGSLVQVVTVVGEAGIGKSRLIEEFERSLELLPVRVCRFKARGQPEMEHVPYALARDLLANHFTIHKRNSGAVARAKLTREIMEVMKEDKARARERAHIIGHLLGFDFSESPYLQGISQDAQRLREIAFRDLVQFFIAVTGECSAAVLVLEDFHWADEGSFDLFDYLIEECQGIPLLVVCLARPSIYEGRPLWQVMESLNGSTYTRLKLIPLSAIDSRHLVTELLAKAAHVPLKVMDLIVTGADGNPLYIEEAINMLVAEEVIVKGPGQWRVQMGKVTDELLPPTLAGLFQARLERLPLIERETLQRAAVSGPVFWDSVVTQTAQAIDKPVTAEQTRSSLEGLAQKGLIRRRKSSTLAGEQEYAFRHDTLHQVTYNSLEPEQRRYYHAQAAEWFIGYGETRVSAHSAIVALHYERAGNTEQAAVWYSRAGQQAQDSYTFTTAIRYYRRALMLLGPNGEAIAQRLAINEALGWMLHWQARFDEAVAAFAAMQTAAHALGESAAEARAFQGLFLGQICQGDHSAALASAQQAEVVARATHAQNHLAAALAAKGWANLQSGNLKAGLALGKEGLSISTAAVTRRESAYNLILLGNVYCGLGHHEQANQVLEKALAYFRGVGDRTWEALMLSNLGYVAYVHREYQTAATFYRQGWRITRDIGNHYGAMLCLRKLGEIAQYEDDYPQAEKAYRQAFVLAEKSSNTIYRAHLANDLGQLHLAKAIAVYSPLDEIEQEDDLRQAWTWFERALHLARDAHNQLAVVVAQLGRARYLVETEQFSEALIPAQEAYSVAQKLLELQPERTVRKVLATAWRVLGQVAANLPRSDLPVTVEGQSYDAAACFAQSLHLLSTGENGFDLEKAYSLRAWAVFELHRGDQKQGASLWREALSIFTRLGLRQEVAWMSQLITS
jgi:predicted ATPase/class 3 adenylate cyclase